MSLPDRSSTELQLSTDEGARRLTGHRVAFLGKLTGMPRKEAFALVRQHGGTIMDNDQQLATLVVLGDDQPDLATALQPEDALHAQLATDVTEGQAQVIRESEFWQLLGLVDEHSSDEGSARRLYTPAMLAELLGVPVAAIRRWHRRGILVACRSVRKLPYFDFTEVGVARHLVALHDAGCSLAVIDRKLTELQRAMPEVERPLCDPAVVVSGRQLILRHGDDLSEPGGQLLIDFDNPTASDEGSEILPVVESLIPEQDALSTLDQLQQEALQLEDQGELQQALDVYRSLLMAAGPSAELHFAIGDLLYRMGDLSAARERFFAAIELEEEYVEARANLGCVLAENGELEFAVAAFQGALLFHDDYADVHFHLANVLDRQDRHDEAELHWRTFLALAPESPWAESARSRMGVSGDEAIALLTP